MRFHPYPPTNCGKHNISARERESRLEGARYADHALTQKEVAANRLLHTRIFVAAGPVVNYEFIVCQLKAQFLFELPAMFHASVI